MAMVDHFTNLVGTAPGPFVETDNIVTLEDISTIDDELPIVVPKGSYGVVEDIDEDGDFYIIFTGISEPRWVAKEGSPKMRN